MATKDWWRKTRPRPTSAFAPRNGSRLSSGTTESASVAGSRSARARSRGFPRTFFGRFLGDSSCNRRNPRGRGDRVEGFIEAELGYGGRASQEVFWARGWGGE